MMREIVPIRFRRLLPTIVTMVAAAIWLSAASKASAGIIAPQQMDFNAQDLAKSIQDSASSSTSSRSATSNHENSEQLPFNGGQHPAGPLSLQDSHLPFGSNSSSSSSTSTSGAAGSGAFMGALNSTLAQRDNSPLGQLAEDHGLSLPDPPGTDLLRPPRNQ